MDRLNWNYHMTENEQKNVGLILKHKEDIAKMLAKFAGEISYRSAIHDNSKFDTDEFNACSENVNEFGKHEFDSPGERELRLRLSDAFSSHRKKNRHHPEHFDNGIDGMNLIDLLEMVADWRSASNRNAGDSIRKSLPIVQEKYKISPQLMNVLTNTIRDFNMY